MLRISVLYAILDRSDAIRPAHLMAALAIWQYAFDSARWVFGDTLGDPVADAILSALRTRGALARTAIVDLFGRHMDKGRIDAALALLVAERAGWMSELPPTRITRRTLDEVSDGPPRGAWLHASAAALHLGVGVGAGVMYVTIVGDRPVGRIPPVIRGLAFGTVLWTMAYVGVLPAMGLMPPPPADERRRPAAMLVAHWIHGGCLAYLTERADHR